MKCCPRLVASSRARSPWRSPTTRSCTSSGRTLMPPNTPKCSTTGGQSRPFGPLVVPGVTVVREAPGPPWNRQMRVHIRLPGPGQLQALVRAHAVHGGVQPRTCLSSPRCIARLPLPVRVAVPQLSGEWMVLEVEGAPGCGCRTPWSLTQSIRAALMSHAADPIPMVLSGHEPDGTPAQRPHLSLLPLPFVGREHADGGIRGFALMLPRDATTEDRMAVAGAVQTWGTSGGGRLVLTLPAVEELTCECWWTSPFCEPSSVPVGPGRVNIGAR